MFGRNFPLKPLVIALSCVTLLNACGQKTTEEHLLAARQFAQAQDIPAATLEYKNAIKLAPNNAAARFELGQLYLQQAQYQAAEKELNRALENGYRASDVVPLLALVYQKTGAENALAGISHTTDGMTSVEQVEVGFRKLQALLQLEQKEEALALIDELLTIDTSSVYKGLVATYPSLISEDYQQALEATQRLREQAPTNPDVLMQLGRLYLLQKTPSEAIAVFQEYVRLNKDDLAATFMLISLLMEQRLTEDAEPLVDNLLKQNDKHPLLNQYKGIILAAKSNFESALARLETAITSGSNDPVARLVAGVSAYQLGDFEATNRHLSVVANILPENHPGLRMLADSLLQLGNNTEATSVLSRLSGDASTDAALFSKAGYQLLRAGNLADAQLMVSKSDELSESAEDLTRLGVLKLSLNDVSGVLNLEQALASAPNALSTQRTLIAAYIATRQFDKAESAVQQWQEKAPQSLEPLLFLADLALQQQQLEKAEKAIKEAEKIDANDTSVKIARVKWLISNDAFQEARDKMALAIASDPENIDALLLNYALGQRLGDTAKAISDAQMALRASPDSPLLQLLLARLYAAERDFTRALSTLTSELNASTERAYWQLKGQLLIQTSQLEDAKQHYSRWLSYYPFDKDAALGRLLLLDVEQKYSEATSLLNKLLDKRPDNQLRALAAHFAAMQGDIKQSRQWLSNLPEAGLALPFVKGIEGRLALLEGKYEEALPKVQAAYQATPNSSNLLMMLVALEQNNKAADALNLLQSHWQGNPDDVAAAMLLAERLISQDSKQAIDVYERLVANDRANFVVYNNLAYMLLQEGQLARAETLAREALRQQSTNPDTIDTLAQILVRQGKPNEAYEMYQRVSSDTKVLSDEVLYNYVALLASQGKTEQAKRRLNEREWKDEKIISAIEALKREYSL